MWYRKIRDLIKNNSKKYGGIYGEGVKKRLRDEEDVMDTDVDESVRKSYKGVTDRELEYSMKFLVAAVGVIQFRELL